MIIFLIFILLLKTDFLPQALITMILNFMLIEY